MIAVAAAGALGAVARYLVGAAVASRHRAGFPWATLAVNISGCLALGLVVDRAAAPVLGTGLLGGYTTFSASRSRR